MTAVGQSNPFSDASEYNTFAFIIARATDKMQTVSIVKVKAVNTTALTVDVQVLVNIMTGANVSVPHGVIAARPYYRAQGGTSGIILDPVVGDIGVMVFASRDSSAVQKAKGLANPGSQRRFSWSDGIYFGGILNGTPTQYLKFLPGGITLLSPTAINIQSPANTVTGPLTVTGNTTLQAALTVTSLATFNSDVDVEGNLNVDGAITGTSAVFSGSVTASSFIGGGGGGGSVTSVGISTPGVGVLVGGGPITTSGTLTVDLSSSAYAALALAVTALQPSAVPLTTKGDLLGFSTLNMRIPAGTNGYVLTADSTAAPGVSWQPAAAGGSSPFNVTPDTHGTIPTGVGLGPNDEFEGASLDTAGTRYAGATAWTWINQNGAVATLIDGGLVMACDPTATGDNNNIILQPMSASTWTVPIKYAVHAGNGGNGSYGFIVRNSANGRYTKFGVYNPGSFQPLVQQLTTPTAFNANPLIGGVSFPSLSTEMEWLYMQVINDATSLFYYWSLTGLPGTFVFLYSETIASWLGAVTDIGLCVNRNAAGGTPAMMVDWFRRTA